MTHRTASDVLPTGAGRRLPEDGARRVIVESAGPEVDGGRYPVKRVARRDGRARGRSDRGRSRRGRGSRPVSPRCGRTLAGCPAPPGGNDRLARSFVAKRSACGRSRSRVGSTHSRRGGVTRRRSRRRGRTLQSSCSSARATCRGGGSARRARRPSVAGAARGRGACRARPDARPRRAHRGGDQRSRGARDGRSTRSRERGPLRPHASHRRRAGAGALQRLVRVVSPLVRRARASTARLPTSSGWLAYVAEMGFDVLYLPPIHPIGRAFRKGKNNTLTAGPDDVGSPWAIGARRGRPQGDPSRARHARRLRAPRGDGARDSGIEVALDIAFQCSPDHPYVKEHPEWFVAAPRRHDPVRREPAEEVPGHLPVRLRVRRLASALARAARRVPLLDRAGRQRLPRRQSAHQGASLLGVVHRRGQGAPPRVDLSRRGVHAAQADVRAGEARLHAVVHVLHLAEHEGASSTSTSRELTAAPVASSFGRTSGRTRRTSCPSICRLGGRPTFIARLVLAAHARRATTASTARRSS